MGGEDTCSRTSAVLLWVALRFRPGSICWCIDTDDIIVHALEQFTEGYAFPTKFGDVCIL